MNQSDEWVTRTNISDFRRKLETETNADKRRVIAELLEKEEAKLREEAEMLRLMKPQQSIGLICTVASRAEARFAAADEQRAIIKSDLKAAVHRAKAKLDTA